MNPVDADTLGWGLLVSLVLRMHHRFNALPFKTLGT